MLVKDVLLEIKEIKHKLDRDYLLLKYYDEESKKITTISYDQIKTSSTKNTEAPFEKWVLKRLQKEHEIKELEFRIEDLRLKMINYLEKIKSKEHMLIIMYRDLKFMKFEEIMSEMHLSRSSIYRIYNEARTRIDDDKIL